MHKGSETPSDSHDTLLLDLDGVVYLGPDPVKGAPEHLARARARGLRLAFVTNNASRTAGAIADRLTGLGIDAVKDDVVTASQAAARLVAERVPAGSAVLAVGGMGLRMALRERGLRPVSTAGADPVAVVQGFSPDLSYSLLAEGGLAVRRGAWFVATNPDSTWPSARGVLPGNGSMAQVIRNATGQVPEFAGKPEPPLHREAMIRTGARSPLVVGDRLDTDIEGAHRAGADSMVVLTGVAGPLDLLTAEPRHRPTYLADDLGGLFVRPAPAVQEGDRWTCNGWTARWDGRLKLDGSGERIDGLRAACAAAWHGTGEGAAQADAVRDVSEQLAQP